MTPISLFIPDDALREAVAEQIAASGMESRAIDAAQNPTTGIVIIDEDSAGKKTRDWNAGPEKPVILLLRSAEENEADFATETFTKPLRLGHLIARLRYYMETAPLLRESSVDFGPYRLEPQARRVVREDGGEPVRLTEKETALLVFLAQHKQPATKRDILAEVWGYDERIDTRTLETHIYQLRRKLDAGEWLINEAGAYRLAQGKNI